MLNCKQFSLLSLRLGKIRIRIGSERRFRRFYAKTFRNSENPGTHKDVFHLGLSL